MTDKQRITSVRDATTGGPTRGTDRNRSSKTKVTLRLDTDVSDAFKATGTGWQTHINAHLLEAVASGRVKT